MRDESIRFSEEDLHLFAAASGDRNPLHLSFEYARQTSYGQRVVFGALGAIACLGRIPAGNVSAISAEFLRPMFLNVDYRAQVESATNGWVVRLFDGTVPVLSLNVKSAAGSLEPHQGFASHPHFARTEAAASAGGLAPGYVVTGRHCCDGGAVERLRTRWGILVHPLLISALGFSSYFVGMEMPGRSALFFKVALQFEALTALLDGCEYRVAVRSIDSRTSQIKMDVALAFGDSRIASGEFQAFERPPMPVPDESLMPASKALRGKTALVIGASRGLGAATQRALEGSGAAVYTLSRSTSGDASDPQVLQSLREQILTETGRLDFLICNACPALLPLRLEPNALLRIQNYIASATALVAAPLAVFLDLLNESSGCAVVVSSVAVERPVREWPHYVAAKDAVEGLARVAAMQYPKVASLIIRPDKLLTEMTNTPMGRRGAAPPEQLAARIAARLAQPLSAGATEIFS